MKLTAWQERLLRWYHPKDEADQILGFLEGMDEDDPSNTEGGSSQ